MVLPKTNRGASTGTSHQHLPVYDAVVLKYPFGGPAVLRQTDGSGFGYYPSGRKAVCINVHGRSNGRFSAIVYDDAPDDTHLVGLFDERGIGWATNSDDERIEKTQSGINKPCGLAVWEGVQVASWRRTFADD
ncbi:hypothetical protein Pmar_PMAR011192 [Perkinsus marinus ATCC 50983]|uniref:FAM194 C-terminal domain-containing protein n=1 Tax=Perkinsus marinus (strain ATCC 50983 / TXsc) TaxID=423536 RepID=C5KN25_PERM5|nr:hypothetical protein Pmar_PMAR011192 [Perkinsus marinus ATCC 50983]EER14118.1 hypothetical protein Pmar_PMAR011192 [Perkinsus marinus ATCC 50983]|eukprot:XP_002782323.1 hypothetical protein Pmar_PMAR011192 [Perkinsus marinus ATCC 50983]